MSKIWRALLVKEDPFFSENHGLIEAVVDDIQGAIAIIKRTCPGHRIVDVYQTGEIKDGIEYEIVAETCEIRQVDAGEVCCDAEKLRTRAGEISHDADVRSDSTSQANDEGSASIRRRRGEEAIFRISDHRLAKMRKSAHAAQSAPNSGFRRRSTD